LGENTPLNNPDKSPKNNLPRATPGTGKEATKQFKSRSRDSPDFVNATPKMAACKLLRP
jgi:hypothetical protein